MSSWKWRYHATLGALAQIGSAALLVVGATESAIGAMLAGGMLGVAGLLLWGAAARERGRAESEQEAVMSSSSTDRLLFELQREVAALRTDHDAVLRAQLLVPRDVRPDAPLLGSRDAGVDRRATASRGVESGAELLRRTGNTPLPPPT